MSASVQAAPAQPTDAERGRLLTIVRERSYRYGRYTLSSGAESNIYFNMKPTMMLPEGALLIARQFIRMAGETGATCISGLEMGAVPVMGSIVALSAEYGRPLRAVFVRKAPKTHGTRDVMEGLAPGETLDGVNVLVIDDVATSGGSIMKAIDAVRSAGGVVTDAACIVNREEGGAELLGRAGVRLHSILHAREFLEAGQSPR